MCCTAGLPLINHHKSLSLRRLGNVVWPSFHLNCILASLVYMLKCSCVCPLCVCIIVPHLDAFIHLRTTHYGIHYYESNFVIMELENQCLFKGVVQTPTQKDDIIWEQPLKNQVSCGIIHVYFYISCLSCCLLPGETSFGNLKIQNQASSEIRIAFV